MDRGQEAAAAKTKGKPVKVLMAKTSLDGHWRGIAMVSTALRDAGMEVIYAGELTAEQIVNAAVQEDVDVIGLNIGGRYAIVERSMALLREKGLSNMVVVAGGTIPPEDIEVLIGMGVDGVFPPGSRLDDIVAFIEQRVYHRPSQDAPR
ncbi:MAG: cobalamin-dependent protein [Dehalococcoidia bacterium]